MFSSPDTKIALQLYDNRRSMLRKEALFVDMAYRKSGNIVRSVIAWLQWLQILCMCGSQNHIAKVKPLLMICG